MNTQMDHRRKLSSRLLVLFSFLAFDLMFFFVVFFGMAMDTSTRLEGLEIYIMGLAALSVVGTFLLAFLPSFVSIAVAVIPILAIIITLVYASNL